MYFIISWHLYSEFEFKFMKNVKGLEKEPLKTEAGQSGMNEFHLEQEKQLIIIKNKEVLFDEEKDSRFIKSFKLAIINEDNKSQSNKSTKSEISEVSNTYNYFTIDTPNSKNKRVAIVFSNKSAKSETDGFLFTTEENTDLSQLMNKYPYKPLMKHYLIKKKESKSEKPEIEHSTISIESSKIIVPSEKKAQLKRKIQ